MKSYYLLRVRIIHFPMQDFQTIAHLIPNFADRVDDPPASIANQNTMRNIFRQLLGQSTHFIQPVLFRSGRLIVYAQAAVWGQHIQHRHDRLLQKCQKTGLHVTHIKVKISPDKVQTISQFKPRKPTYNPGRASVHLDKLANQLSLDDPLKDTVKRLAKRIRRNYENID